MRKRRKTIRRRENIIAIYPSDWVTVGLETYRSWCRIPYHGHPHGCAMWKSKKNCDAAFRKIHTFDEVFDRTQIGWCVWEPYDLGAQAKRMKALHPDWTKYQCRNVLYWQLPIKNLRNKRVEMEFRRRQLWGKYAGITEGFCINVFSTMRNAGLPLDPIKDIEVMKKLCFIVRYKEGGPGEAEQKRAGRTILIY